MGFEPASRFLPGDLTLPNINHPKAPTWLDFSAAARRGSLQVFAGGRRPRRTGEQLAAEASTTCNTRGGTRTRNLLLRREAPYPLGHTSSEWSFARAAPLDVVMHRHAVAKSWTALALAEGPSLVVVKHLSKMPTSSADFGHTRGGTRTRNLLLRREAPYPLGHTSSGVMNRDDLLALERA